MCFDGKIFVIKVKYFENYKRLNVQQPQQPSAERVERQKYERSKFAEVVYKSHGKLRNNKNTVTIHVFLFVIKGLAAELMALASGHWVDKEVRGDFPSPR